MKSLLRNWKTTGAGLLMVGSGVAGLFGIKGGADPSVAGPQIIAGIGLIFAKDGNVTGGSTPQ